MSNIRITKQFTFETGHALYGYDGKCKNVHGHSYKLDVTVIGTPISDTTHAKYGMVIDFGDLKKIVNQEIVNVFDHVTVSDSGMDILLVDYQPTTEMMVADFAAKISALLPERIRLHSLRLSETATSYAEWYATDQN